MSLLLGKLKLDGKCHIMGILNATPDSFYDNFFDTESIQERIKEMIAEGAEIIDVGGESTRPGSKPVSVEEELERVIPAIEFIRSISDIPISIDTQKAEVARKAIQAGACVVNDVGGLRNNDMISLIAELQIPVIIMHMQGTPENMQKNPQYDDTVQDIKNWLEERINAAEIAGIKRSNIVVDPGIGFGKNLKHNITLISKVSIFHSLGFPIMLGLSRKRFIKDIAGNNDSEERVGGTISSCIYSSLQGVQILRVHDVNEANQALKIFQKLQLN